MKHAFIYTITYMHAYIHRWCIVPFPCFTINVVSLVWVFSFLGLTCNTRQIVGDERSPCLPTLTIYGVTTPRVETSPWISGIPVKVQAISRSNYSHVVRNDSNNKLNKNHIPTS